MTAAIMTSKGQVTIPADVRKRLGVNTGDRIEFFEIEKGKFAIRAVTGDVRALKGMLKPPAKPVTIEDMDEAIMEEVEERSRR